MSASGRTGRWANAALVVSVAPGDYPGGPLAGLRFQRELEERASALGGRRGVPGQRVVDFLRGETSRTLPASSCPWSVVSFPLDECLPPFVAGALRQALPELLSKFPPLRRGLLLGVETRTSSPVRIPRAETMESVGFSGLYPIGEGAGYAGGIVSAAVDGVRAADAYAERLGGGLVRHPAPFA
jgi:uncharacterized protein